VPSTNKNGIVFRSNGYGEAFYNILTDGKGAYDVFHELCRGGELLKQAQVAGKNKCSPRDILRSQVSELLRAMISTYCQVVCISIANSHQDQDTHVTHGTLAGIPRKPGALIAELEKRRLRWSTPEGWPQDLLGLEKLVTSRTTVDLNKVKEALDAGTLKLIK
jgi:hypothetical protein